MATEALAVAYVGECNDGGRNDAGDGG